MVKRKQKKDESMEYTMSSGNVFADFAISNPEEAKAKADLAMQITAIIKDRKLTQQQAADLIGIDQPKISKIIRGLLAEFTIERLMRFVLHLGFDIELKLRRHNAKTLPAIHVAMENKLQQRPRAS
ncbi:MAG: helix-turn-helix domain-containing protein [Parachlamydia sp.]|nr:helix-turn-helix domain-containing protein [Parachlamydia sp.]